MHGDWMLRAARILVVCEGDGGVARPEDGARARRAAYV